MISENFKMALASIRSAKFRSMLTMLGLIIGVSSVVTIVSLGEGVKKQVSGQIDKLGTNLIVIKPGKRQSANAINLNTLSVLGGQSTGSLTTSDLEVVKKVPGVGSAVPVSVVTGVPSFENRKYEDSITIATTEKLPELLNQKIEYGNTFNDNELNKNYAVIGRSVAEKLFLENVPIGKTFKFRNTDFVVTGVFEQTVSSEVDSAVNFNNALFIPIGISKNLGGSSEQLYQILVQAKSTEDITKVSNSLKTAILANHAGQDDFAVLKQEESLNATDEIFYQITLFIAGVAFISLVVGGIGIMNIMFATVSERTREIGIRKAIGATNRQILGQFMTEAIVLSIVGGLLGIVVALIINLIVRIGTSLQPVTSLPVIAIATGISILVGILSGILPAAKAARKQPMESLRYE